MLSFSFPEVVEFVGTTAALGLIPAIIAKNKGRSFARWWAYGFLLFIVALVHSIVIKKNDNALRNEGMKKCSFCAEFIKAEAKICRYCGKESAIS